ncbi:hypothetical protein LCM20_13285 [Halobacillus litoralis]|uniref:hypothetical protein n=1 Tax=Halobacillus litoralis TaxID=45668 RepID=UPI001CD2EC27|nr:hypothetical protein [Halobacillus litoralis]MCA0971574.1 hypothetical protein [Halobacillus litoralis]
MKEIVTETINTLKFYLPNLIEGTKSTAEKFQAHKDSEALKVLPNIVEGIDWVYQAIAGIQKNGGLPKIDLEELSSILPETLRAIEVKDYVLLSDLLEYEIVHVLEKWNDQLLVTQ